jgi:hypothetical protein
MFGMHELAALLVQEALGKKTLGIREVVRVSAETLQQFNL